MRKKSVPIHLHCNQVSRTFASVVGEKSRVFDLLKKTPLLAIGAFACAQLATLLPFLVSGKIRPLFFVYLDGIDLVALTPTVCIAAGHAMALAALLLTTRMVFRKWGLRLAGAAVVVHFLCMLVGVLYYANFGQYPRWTLVQDLLITPTSVIGYGISGATPSDFMLGLLSATLVVLATIYGLRNIADNSTPGDACFLSMALAIGFLTVGLTLISARAHMGAASFSVPRHPKLVALGNSI